jgi:hypothetical protein
VWTAVALAVGTASFCVEQAARLRRFVELVHRPVERIVAALPAPALLVTEHSPNEMRFLGWIYSFPVRQRADTDPVVTFPRGRPGMVEALRRRFPERECFYLRQVRGDDEEEARREIGTHRAGERRPAAATAASEALAGRPVRTFPQGAVTSELYRCDAAAALLARPAALPGTPLRPTPTARSRGLAR